MNNDIENSNSEYWKQKYLKYKAKYMNLDTKTGGRHHSSHRRSNSYSRQQFNPFMQQPGFNPFSQQPVVIGPNGVMTSGLMGPGMMGPGMVGPGMMGPGGLMVGPSGIMSPGGIIQPGLSSPGFIMTPRGLVPFFKINSTPVTPVTTDAIYNAFNKYLSKKSHIYLHITTSPNKILVLTANNNTYLKIDIDTTDTNYIKQIKKGLDTLLTTPLITDTSIEDVENYNIISNKYVVFKATISGVPPAISSTHSEAPVSSVTIF